MCLVRLEADRVEFSESPVRVVRSMTPLDNPRSIWSLARLRAMRSWRLIALLLSMFGALARAELPNIVVVLADDMGWGDPQSYQPASKIPTPNIDRLAREGMRFTDAHSPSAVCTPTRYGLLTGRYAWRTWLTSGVLDGFGPPLIDPQQDTVALLLKRSGYRTSAVGKWHLGMSWVDTRGKPMPRRTGGFRPGDDVDYTAELQGGPLDVGFDTFLGISASLDMSPYCFLRNRSVEMVPDIAVPSGRADIFSGLSAGVRSQGFRVEDVLPRLAKEAVLLIDQHAGREEPFFLYMPLASPHLPVAPVRTGSSRAGLYGDFVFETDHALGRVLEALDRNGLTEETLVLFTSDNGGLWHWWDFRAADDGGAAPSTARGDYVRGYGHRSNAAWRGTKADIFEGGHRVPFVVRWPGQVAAGTTSDALVVLTDLYATVAEIVESEMQGSSGQDSHSLVPVLRGSGSSGRTSAVHHSARGMFAIRKGDWKLIAGRGSGGFTAPRMIDGPGGQLYNLAADPRETENLYDTVPEVVTELKELLRTVRE